MAALFIDGDYLRTVWSPDLPLEREGGQQGPVAAGTGVTALIRTIEESLGVQLRLKVCVLTDDTDNADFAPAATPMGKGQRLSGRELSDTLKRGGVQCVHETPVLDQTAIVTEGNPQIQPHQYRLNPVDAAISTKAAVLACRGGNFSTFIFLTHNGYYNQVLSLLASEGKYVLFASFGSDGLHPELRQYASPHPLDSSQSGIVTFKRQVFVAPLAFIRPCGIPANSSKLTAGSLASLQQAAGTQRQSSRQPSVSSAQANGAPLNLNASGGAPSATQPQAHPQAHPPSMNALDDIMAGFEVSAPPPAPPAATTEGETAPPPHPNTGSVPTSASSRFAARDVENGSTEGMPNGNASVNSSFVNSSVSPSRGEVLPPPTSSLPEPQPQPQQEPQPFVPTNTNSETHGQASREASHSRPATNAEELIPEVQVALPVNTSMHFDHQTRRFYYSQTAASGEVNVRWDHPMGPTAQKNVEDQVDAWYEHQKAKRKEEKLRQSQVRAQPTAAQPPVAQPPVAQPPPVQPAPVPASAQSRGPAPLDLARYSQESADISLPNQVASQQAVATSTLSYQMPNPQKYRDHNAAMLQPQQPPQQRAATAPAPAAPVPAAPMPPQQPAVAPAPAPPAPAPAPVQVPAPQPHPQPLQPPVAQAPPPTAPPAPAPAPAAETPLPPGWERRYDPNSGKHYYLDHNTQRTSWVRPPA